MLDISIKAEELWQVLGMPITNSLLLTWLVVIVALIGSWIFRRRLATIPGKIQNLIEIIISSLFDFMTELFGSTTIARRYFSLIATIFLFILLNNWFGILPVLGALGLRDETGHLVPLFRTAASDINTTLALAIIAVVSIQVIGIATLGFFKHLNKFLNFQSPIAFATGLLELISEAAKMVSFSFRLFGNIFAGEVLLIIISFLAPYIIPLPFYVLEIFAGFIQALVFAMLTMVFIKIAISDHDHEMAH